MSYDYDLIILGAGSSGEAVAMVTLEYTDIPRTALIDRRPGPGQVQTARGRHSQTGHRGPLESNYSVDKAIYVSRLFDPLLGFVRLHAPGVAMRMNGHLLGIGAEEVALLRERFKKLSPHFPDMRLLERDEIERLEPALIEGRDPSEPVVSLFTDRAYAVDFQSLAGAMHNHARLKAQETGRTFDTYFDTEVESVRRTVTGFEVVAGGRVFTCRSLEIGMGNNSVLVAHELGRAKHLVPVTVGGSYYVADAKVTSKVYTVQDEAVPLAALHVDPDVNNRSIMRLGPIAILLFMMERDSYRTVWEFAKSGTLTPRGLWGLARALLFNKATMRFAVKSAQCVLPFVGKYLFLRQIRRIIPGLQMRDITFAHGAGGVRGQLVDTDRGILSKDIRIDMGDMPANCIAAPSPGASACVGNAIDSVRNHVRWQPQFTFDEARMRAELLGEQAAS